jgi:hypothetical protein
LERAANFLEDLLALVGHPRVTRPELEALVRQVFLRITIAGKEFVDIEPKPEYAPLFATMVTAQKVGIRSWSRGRLWRGSYPEVAQLPVTLLKLRGQQHDQAAFSV